MKNKKIQGSLLRMRATEIEELNVIGACIQGAMSCYGEMEFDSKEYRFAAILVRYTWEDAASQQATHEYVQLKQIRTALRVESVKQVRVRGIDLKNENKLLELVTVKARKDMGKIKVHLIFSSGGEIYLDVDKLDVRMEDLESPIDSQVKVSFADDKK